MKLFRTQILLQRIGKNIYFRKSLRLMKSLVGINIWKSEFGYSCTGCSIIIYI